MESTEKQPTTSGQIEKWLKKLERESWQLELLVSAFTIFLLIEASSVFNEFLESIPYRYNLTVSILSFIYIFFVLIGLSLKALTVFLIGHLLLRGFWIGAIGLRSVQSSIDVSSLNYSEYFTEKLRNRIIGLDRMVLRLDEVCSVIFAFSFLIISMLLAFGLFLLYFGGVALVLMTLVNLFSGTLAFVVSIVVNVVLLSIMLTGLIYQIDYFTLGFFKKFRWTSRWYFPIYRFYGFITLSSISNSIYYYLISKFSKRRIRIVYAVVALLMFLNWAINYDQFQFYSDTDDQLFLSNNAYASLRPPDAYIKKASIQSHTVDGPYIELFLRYDPADNERIRKQCPDFEPLKNDGVNLAFKLRAANGNLMLSGQDFEGENRAQLLSCLSSIYQVSINDSLCRDLQYYFYEHPAKKQKGLITQLATKYLHAGQNTLTIEKVSTDSTKRTDTYLHIPFWYVE